MILLFSVKHLSQVFSRLRAANLTVKNSNRSVCSPQRKWSKDIPHFAQIASSLTNLFWNGATFVGTEEAENVVLDLKSFLDSKPIPFYVHLILNLAVDLSDVAIGEYFSNSG